MAVSAQPIVNAIKTGMAARGVPFGDAKKPTVATGDPWVVGWTDPGQVTDRTLVSRDGFELVLVAHCCGISPESARIARGVLADVLLGLHRQVIGGRLVQMPRNEPGPPMQRDDDAQPAIYVQIVEWRLATSPA